MLENEFNLIKQAQEGNRDAFGSLYDSYHQQIYRFILLKISNESESEDIMHDVFLSAWQNIKNYVDQGHPFSSWLYQIARNRIIDHYRLKKEIVPIDTIGESALQVIPALDKQLDQKSNLIRIKNALSQLSEDQQNIIILRFIEDFSPTEVASILNKKEGTIRIIQHRALQKLKSILNG